MYRGLIMNARQNVMNSSREVSSFDALIKFLEKVHYVVSDYVFDENGSAKNVFFQDLSMKDMFNFFPERVCIDCTYKQFDVGFYMYLFICEDSNGKNIIIAVAFLQSNDVNSLGWLFDTFKLHNPNHRRIKSLAIDFQIKQREFIRDFFPQALQIICFFHAYVCFKSDSKEFFNLNYITEEQMLFANESFRNLFFAQNQAEFELRYGLYTTLPPVLVSYLENVWMPYQQEWRICLDYAHEDVFHNINFFLQEVSDAIAAISAANMHYVEFIKDIFLFIALKKKDKFSFSPKPDTFLFSQFSPEYQITKFLTPYAAKFVIKQLDLSKDINYPLTGTSDAYSFNYLGFTISATINQCSCHFFLFTLLPCRHIFVVRKLNHQCLFDSMLVTEDWNLKYYEHSIICMDSHLEKGTISQIPRDEASRTFLARQILGTSLLSMLDLSHQAFTARVEELKQILNAWKTNGDVSLQFAGIYRSCNANHTYALGLDYNNHSEQNRSKDGSVSAVSQMVSNPPSSLNCNSSSLSLNNLQLNEMTATEPLMSSLMSDILSSNVIDDCDLQNNSGDISACNMPSTSSTIISDDVMFSLKSLTSTDLPSASSPIPQFSTKSVSEKVSFFEINQSVKFEERNLSNYKGSNDVPSDPLNRTHGFFQLKAFGVQEVSSCHSLNPRVENLSQSSQSNGLPPNGTSNKPVLQHDYELTDFSSSILNGSKINLAYVVYLICHDKNDCIAWLRKYSLIPTSQRCQHCGFVMVCRSFPHTQDGSSWCCTRTGGKRCTKRQSIRVGTWFGIAHMPIENLLVFCYLWINRYEKNIIIQVISVSTSNYIKLDKFFSRVCIHSVKNNHLIEKESSSYRSARDVWIEQNASVNTDSFLPFLKAVDAVWKNEFLGGPFKSQ